MRDLPVELDLEAARLGDYDRETVIRLFREYEFRTLIERLPAMTGESAEDTAEALRERRPSERLGRRPPASPGGPPAGAPAGRPGAARLGGERPPAVARLRRRGAARPPADGGRGDRPSRGRWRPAGPGRARRRRPADRAGRDDRRPRAGSSVDAGDRSRPRAVARRHSRPSARRRARRSAATARGRRSAFAVAGPDGRIVAAAAPRTPTALRHLVERLAASRSSPTR